MGEQQRRRGGRGRSGRGGKIPRRGEGGAPSAIQDEAYASFPLDVRGPIRVPSALDEAAVTAAFERVLRQERRQAEALRALASQGGDAALGEIQTQVERHRDTLEQLARDLDLNTGPAEESIEAEPTAADVAAGQRLSRLGWTLLQRLAYASGDKRIDRVVKPVLREKERHTRVLESAAVVQELQSLFKDTEE